LAATRSGPFSGEIADWLRERMRGAAFTLRGLVVELAERGVKTHARAVWVFAHAEGLSFKKNTPGLGADASGHRAQANPVEGPAGQRRS
jgi:transposase